MSRTKSNKAKGRKGQQEVRDLILKHFPELEPEDVRSTPMGSPGEDLLMSPAALKKVPWSVEVKRKKSIAACRFVEQAASQDSRWIPVAFFREDRGPWYAAVDADYLLDLVRSLSDLDELLRRLVDNDPKLSLEEFIKEIGMAERYVDESEELDEDFE